MFFESIYRLTENQREKNRFLIDKNQPYEYNIAIIILGELCKEGIIDIFDMAEALIKLRKLYNLPVIDIYGKKESDSSDYKAVTREHRSGITRPQIVAQ